MVDHQMKWLVFGLAAMFLIGIGLYFSALSESISTVRATRPVLVFTLIVAMLGFGGMLMAKSLFGKEPKEEFEIRFSKAREIFLVYAGIFGTIIGFYFGAADEIDTSTPPNATVAVRGPAVSVQVSGGTPPFFGFLEQAEPKIEELLSINGERLLTAQLDIRGPCPNQANIIILDGHGRKGTIPLTDKDITGWPAGCGAAVVNAGATGVSPAAAMEPLDISIARADDTINNTTAYGASDNTRVND